MDQSTCSCMVLKPGWYQVTPRRDCRHSSTVVLESNASYSGQITLTSWNPETLPTRKLTQLNVENGDGLDTQSDIKTIALEESLRTQEGATDQRKFQDLERRNFS